MSIHTALTAAQQRYLAEITAAGPAGRRYNGRAQRPLEALEALGLITLDFDLLPQVKGNGLEFVQRYTAKVAAAPRPAAPGSYCYCCGADAAWVLSNPHGVVCATCQPRKSDGGLDPCRLHLNGWQS